MGPIRIISTVKEDGKLHLPDDLKLQKGKVEVVIIPLGMDKKKKTKLHFSNHSCGQLLIDSLRREDIYDSSGR